MTATTSKLQDAKARFSELVRRAKSDGPQHITVHGREEVVVISVEDFRKVSGKLPVGVRNSGQAMIEALKGLRGLELLKFSA